MSKKIQKYLFLLTALLIPLIGQADEPIKQPHKPPILTTTAIILETVVENGKLTQSFEL